MCIDGIGCSVTYTALLDTFGNSPKNKIEKWNSGTKLVFRSYVYRFGWVDHSNITSTIIKARSLVVPVELCWTLLIFGSWRFIYHFWLLWPTVLTPILQRCRWTILCSRELLERLGDKMAHEHLPKDECKLEKNAVVLSTHLTTSYSIPT